MLQADALPYRGEISGREHPGGDTDCRAACGNVADNQRIRGDHCTVANGNRSNDARVASDQDVIADAGSAWSRSGADGAHMMECAVGPDLGGAVHSDGTAMRDDQAWADLSVGVEVDVCQHRQQLFCDAERQPRGCPKPSGSTPPDDLLEPVECERPKSLRTPTAVPVHPETRQIRSARSPLAIPCPRLDCVSVVLHRVRQIEVASESFVRRL
jgi:hypothetical protein